MQSLAGETYDQCITLAEKYCLEDDTILSQLVNLSVGTADNWHSRASPLGVAERIVFAENVKGAVQRYVDSLHILDSDPDSDS